MVDSSVVERQTQKGGTLIYTTLTVEFDFVSAEDGSTHTVRTVGEAMDSADKSSNKAMSAAYKYAAFMAFCIPTEGDNDADATTYELAPERSSEPRVAPNPSSPLLQDRVEKGSGPSGGPATQEVAKPLTPEQSNSLMMRLSEGLNNQPSTTVAIDAWLAGERVAKAITQLMPAHKASLDVEIAAARKWADKPGVSPQVTLDKIAAGEDGFVK